MCVSVWLKQLMTTGTFLLWGKMTFHIVEVITSQIVYNYLEMKTNYYR